MLGDCYMEYVDKGRTPFLISQTKLQCCAVLPFTSNAVLCRDSLHSGACMLHDSDLFTHTVDPGLNIRFGLTIKQVLYTNEQF